MRDQDSPRITRRRFLAGATALSAAAAAAFTAAMALTGAHTLRVRTAVVDPAKKATAASRLVNISPPRSNGAEDKWPSEIWLFPAERTASS